MTVYVLCKLDINPDVVSVGDIISEIGCACDSDNIYKGVNRYIVTDINNPDTQIWLDGIDLQSTACDTKA